MARLCNSFPFHVNCAAPPKSELADKARPKSCSDAGGCRSFAGNPLPIPLGHDGNVPTFFRRARRIFLRTWPQRGGTMAIGRAFMGHRGRAGAARLAALAVAVTGLLIGGFLTPASAA